MEKIRPPPDERSFRNAKKHDKTYECNHGNLEAFFVEGQNIGQVEELKKLAGEIGLDEKAFEEALRTRRHKDAHQLALRHAYQAGVSAVPMFVIGDQVLTGLQSKERLEAVIEAGMRKG